MAKDKDRVTSLIRPGDRPEKNGEGTAYLTVDDLIMRMSDEVGLPDYVDSNPNESCAEVDLRRILEEFGEFLDAEEGEDEEDFPMEAVLSGKSEICFRDGMAVKLDEASRRTMVAHWKTLGEAERREFSTYVRRSHGNFCRALSILESA